jgi:hypothetical protein
MTDLMELLSEQAADSEVAWSLATFGALAEFMRDAGELVVLKRDMRFRRSRRAADCASRGIRTFGRSPRSLPPPKAGLIASRFACRKQAAR